MKDRFVLNIDLSDPTLFPANDPQYRAEMIAELLEAVAWRLKMVNANGEYTDARGGWTGHYQTLWSDDGHETKGAAIDIGRYAIKPCGEYWP